MSRKAMTAVLIAFCAAALLRCEMLAGSSVGTGNPVEIKVSFTGASGPAALTGSVDVFAATQIPVPGFRTEPIASFPVNGATEVMVRAEALGAIPDSLWPKSSRQGDSLFTFNLVVSGAAQGAIIKGLIYRKKEGDFALKPEDVEKFSDREARGDVKAALVDLVGAEARVDPASLYPDRNYYLFIRGTRFSALADSGRFVFPSLPKGVHELAYLSLPKEKPGGTNDSAYVHALNLPLNTQSSDSLSVGGIIESVPLPK